MQPASVTQTFRVRRYECDAYGHVNNTTYLRYLEEVEYTAGLEDGHGHHLLTTDIEFLEPVSFGDEVSVSAFTREERPFVRSYQFRRADDNLVATATATWAPAESTESAASADSKMINDIPPAPDPPEEVFTQQRQIEWRDVDARSRVSPATLSAFAEDCGVDLCAAYGWPLDRCTAEGFAMVLRRHQISYGEAVALGGSLEIRTWASDLRRAMATRHYLISSGGKQVARFRSRYVWVDIDTRRPIRIPAAFLEDFRANFSGWSRRG